MQLEHLIKIAIYIHAFFGGVGLLSGFIGIVVKKGSQLHKRTGKIFSYSMCISAFISLIIARMPKHENLFLFLIGVLTIYMVIAGNRALSFKNKSKISANHIDKIISFSMLLISAGMIVIGILDLMHKIDGGILYIFFGAFGLIMVRNDFKMFRSIQTNRMMYMKNHIGRMVGAFVASVTAFIVAGLNIGTIIFWVLPTIIGLPYIIFWQRKFDQSTT